MASHIHILLIEHNRADRDVFERELKKAGIEYILRNAENIEQVDHILNEYLPDVVVCDFVSISLSAPEAVAYIKQYAPAIPLIMYSGTQDEEIVVESMKAGAADYIFKGHSTRLSHSIFRAIEQKRIQEELRHARERFNTLTKVATVGIFLAAQDGSYLYVNERWCDITGLSTEESFGEGFIEAVHSHDKKRVLTEWKKAVANKEQFYSEYRVTRKTDDAEIWVLAQALPEIESDGTVAGYVGTITDITDRMHSEIQIDQSRKQLRALTVRLQTVREEERTHIAREIHDDLGQALTGLRMDLSWLMKQSNPADKKIQKRLDSMLSLTDTTIHKVRKIATDLRPGILDDLGLAAAIEWQSKDYQERTGIQFQFQSSIEEFVLDEKRSTAFFRIFQESLTNVVRHAQAKNVDISLRQEGNAIVLTVKDDGKGISAHEINNPRSVGFLGMRERAAVFGGEISVSGAPNKGTMVRVKIPIQTDSQ